MRKRQRMTAGILVFILVLAGVCLIVVSKGSATLNYGDYDELIVTSPSFVNSVIPVQYTGNGEDDSPELMFLNLSEEAVSIAIIMDDLDIPLRGVYNHWTIWNIPPRDVIPEGIPHGATVPELDGAVQGVGYGRNRYRGPKPPFGSHRYQFHVFVLDTMLDLKATAGKKELLAAMEGHILQYGSVTGVYPGDETE